MTGSLPRAATPGCYPDQQCCQTGTTAAPDFTCISNRMGYDLNPSAATNLTFKNTLRVCGVLGEVTTV